MHDVWQAFWSDETGQGLVEYALIIALVAVGLIVSATSFLLAVVFVIEKLTVGFEIQGWASTIVIILFLGGVQLLTIGIIGEYISRIYDEVKQRPLYVVRDFDNLDTAPRAWTNAQPQLTAEPNDLPDLRQG